MTHKDEQRLEITETKVKNWSVLVLRLKATGEWIAKASYYHRERSARFWPLGSDLHYKNAAKIIYDIDLPELKLELWKEAAAYESQQRQQAPAEEPAGVRRHSNQVKYSTTRYRNAADHATKDPDGSSEL